PGGDREADEGRSRSPGRTLLGRRAARGDFGGGGVLHAHFFPIWDSSHRLDSKGVCPSGRRPLRRDVGVQDGWPLHRLCPCRTGRSDRGGVERGGCRVKILGVSAFYHDSAAALVSDGRIVAAAQEERFTRKKNDSDFPTHAVRYCLEEGSLGGRDVDYVVFYDKPFLKFDRLLETYLAFVPRGYTSFRTAMPIWIKEKLFQKRLLGEELSELDPDLADPAKLLFTEHHLAHAASAFFPSPFEEAAFLTMDGVGEWTTT